MRLAPESLSVGLSGAVLGVLAGLLHLGLPGSVLFEGLVSFARIAGAVGEVDVVDVVAAAAGYRGEVFDGASQAVAQW